MIVYALASELPDIKELAFACSESHVSRLLSAKGSQTARAVQVFAIAFTQVAVDTDAGKEYFHTLPAARSSAEAVNRHRASLT